VSGHERMSAAFRCGADERPKASTDRELRTVTAIDRALVYFERSPEPYAMLMLDVMRRRFRISSFDDALARYDQFLAEDSPRRPILRIFRRIADYDNVLQPGDDAAVRTQVDRLIVPALYCDRKPPPGDYAAQLQQANGAGEYQRTHALLSLQWLRENRCAMPVSADFESALIDGVAQLIKVDGTVTDLELEAAGFLYAYGHGDRVDAAFIDEALASQNSDGGWLLSNTEQPGSDWHATTTATYLLLHAYCGKRDYPPMLAPGP